MSFNWHQYIHLAATLIVTYDDTESQKEAKLRTSISRAYYGAFCLARNRLAVAGGSVPKSGDVHGFVRRRYQSSANRSDNRIGDDLFTLRRQRNLADYDDKAPVRMANATRAYAAAMGIVRGLEEVGVPE